MAKPTMTTEWAKSYLEHQLSWLSSPCATQLILMIDDLLSSRTTPSATASLTASLIQVQHDVSLGLANLVGLFFSAAESNTSLSSLRLLASYLIELAKLPDAINESPEEKVWDEGGGEMHKIAPGAAMVVEGKRLWSELPMFGWNLTERFQGPEQYLFGLRNPSSPEEAGEKWKDINTLVALIARNPDAKRIPSLAYYMNRSLITLEMALEHSPNTRLGKNTAMHVPAAAVWFTLAEKEVERMCEMGTKRMTAGDLWVERGGNDVVDKRRLVFWRERMAELSYLTQ